MITDCFDVLVARNNSNELQLLLLLCCHHSVSVYCMQPPINFFNAVFKPGSEQPQVAREFVKDTLIHVHYLRYWLRVE